jgi:hypothetical protein
MGITESCSPLNRRKLSTPNIDPHAALKRTNPTSASPNKALGPKAPAPSARIATPVGTNAKPEGGSFP